MIEVANQTNRPIALVTGASSGFGLLTSIRLAQEGYRVIATMRDRGKEESILAKAEENGVLAHLEIMKLDITDHQNVTDVVQAVMERWGQIDVLVNNAGYAVMGVIEEVPMADWRAQLETNFSAWSLSPKRCCLI